jgi:hypothetical protein
MNGYSQSQEFQANDLYGAFLRGEVDRVPQPERVARPQRVAAVRPLPYVPAVFQADLYPVEECVIRLPQVETYESEASPFAAQVRTQRPSALATGSAALVAAARLAGRGLRGAVSTVDAYTVVGAQLCLIALACAGVFAAFSNPGAVNHLVASATAVASTALSS